MSDTPRQCQGCGAWVIEPAGAFGHEIEVEQMDSRGRPYPERGFCGPLGRSVEDLECELDLARPVIEAAVKLVRHTDDMREVVPSMSWPSDRELWAAFLGAVRGYDAAREKGEKP